MDKLRSAVQACIRGIEKAIAEEVSGRIARAFDDDEITLPKPDGRSRRDMRCQHVGRDGKRCANRSRGPRFKYLCLGHSHEAARAKTPKIKKGKKPRRRAAAPKNGVARASEPGIIIEARGEVES